MPGPASSPPSVLILNWRDTRNPEGGGSELYAEMVAAALARDGHDVTIFCAAHPAAPPEEVTGAGVRIVRRGGRRSVYPSAAWCYLRGRLGRPDVVVDVQNGMPFLARLYTRRPVVVLVHHVHREQWRVVLGPVAARVGWWIESWLSPRVHRRCRYVTVSATTRAELAGLGVDPARVTVVHNGVPAVPAGPPVPRSAHPTLLVLGRLVPHKRVEIALATLAVLTDDHPDLELVVAGQGWWLDRLRQRAEALGVTDRVRFAGYVDAAEKHRLLASSWLLLVPSLKEGWGLAAIEAAAHGTPTVAFAHAGGVAESVLHGETGLLADDEDGFVAACRALLGSASRRQAMGAAARTHASRFSWDETAKRFAAVVTEVAEPAERGGTPPAGGSPVAVDDQRLVVDRSGVGGRLLVEVDQTDGGRDRQADADGGGYQN